jgi:putative transposase
MSRYKRLYFNQAVYHVCVRGNNRQYILREEADKITFLESLDKFRRRFGFSVYCFVVMDNHAHLIIKVTSPINISKIMHAVNLSYSVKFRKKYGCTGYVWQGRFKSNVIGGERYIVDCIEYIHNNPIRAKIVENIEDYFWSSYRFYSGLDSDVEKYICLDRFEGLEHGDSSIGIS